MFDRGLEQERKYTKGTQTLYSMSTAYDPGGNILTETILRNNEQIIKNYSYDSLNRIIKENSSSRDNFWQYENYFNNIISTNQNGYNETREVDYMNYKYTQYKQINALPVTYDLNGNFTSYDNKQYLYDWANRLIEVRENGAAVATYTYDALNRRATKYTTSDVKTITFIYDAHQLIEEYSSIFASPDRIYAYAAYLDDPLLMETNSQRYYYLKDRRYNIVGLANESGSLQETYSYSAFGLISIYDSSGILQPKSPLGNPFGYTGRYFDSETQLWYYRNRMYYPQLNRFLQRDPKGYIDGINLYAYVRNNPLRYLDPLGLSAREKAGQSKDQPWWPKDIEKYIPPYGEYGGPSNTDLSFRSKPVDSMDRLFMEHDWYWSQGKGKTGDVVLLVGLANLPLNPQKWEEPTSNTLWAIAYREITIEVIGWRVIVDDN